MYSLSLRKNLALKLSLSFVFIYIILAILSRKAFSISIKYLLILGQVNYFILKNGYFWQLFTSIFIHVNILHLAFNTFFMYIIGTSVENKIGPKDMFLVFLSSGLIGNVFSLLGGTRYPITAGASGGILGLAAFDIIFVKIISGGSLMPAISTLVVLFLMNSFLPGVDILGHLGGIIGGAVIGFIYGKYKVRRIIKYRITLDY